MTRVIQLGGKKQQLVRTLRGDKGEAGPVGVYQFNALIQADAAIPAGTTSITVNINPIYYLTDGQSVKGSLYGIDGTLSRTGTTYSFTRTTAGSAITAPSGSVFVPTQSLTVVLHTPTVQALLDAPVPAVNGLAFQPQGYYGYGDAAMPRYVWIATSTKTHNGGTVLKPTALSSGTPGRYEAIGSRFSPKVFGAKGDGTTDDSNAIQACFNACNSIDMSGFTWVINTTITYTIASGSYSSLDLYLGNGRILYTGSSYVFRFTRVPSNPGMGRMVIEGGTIRGNDNALGTFLIEDGNQCTFTNVKTDYFPNLAAANWEFKNVLTWSENVTLINCSCIDSHIGARFTGTVSPTGRELHSFARLHISAFFVQGVEYAIYADGAAPYHAFINHIKGNLKGNCKSLIYWKGGAANVTISNCGVEQGKRFAVGPQTPKGPITVAATSDQLVGAPGTFDPATEVGKSIMIPEGGPYDPLNDVYNELDTKITAISDDGSTATIARHVSKAQTGITVYVYKSGNITVSSGNLKRLVGPSAGTFSSQYLGWPVILRDGNPLGGDLVSYIKAIAPDGSYADINEQAKVGTNYNADIGTIIHWQAPYNGKYVSMPSINDCSCLGAAGSTTIYYQDSNIPFNCSHDAQQNALSTPTGFAGNSYNREFFWPAWLGFNKGAFAHIFGGKGIVANDRLGGLGAVNLINPGNGYAPSPTASYLAGIIEFLQGAVQQAGRIRFRTANSSGTLTDALTIDESQILTIANSGYSFGKQITDGTALDASLQYVILLMPLTNGNTMTGRVYGTKGIGTNANVAGLDYTVNAATNNAAALTANGLNVGFGQLNAGLVTCTYSGVSYLGVKLGGTANKGLNAPIYFQGVVKNPDANSLTIVAASGVTALTDYTPASSSGTTVYYGSSLPSSPAAGSVWFEQESSGALIETWTFDGTDWVSGRKIGNLYTGNAAISASYTNSHAPVVMQGSKLLVDSFVISGQLAAAGTIDASNDWSFVLNRILVTTGAKSATSTVLVSANASAFSSTGPITPVTTAVGTKYVASGTGAITGLTLSITKTGTPQNLQDVAAQVIYRVCR